MLIAVGQTQSYDGQADGIDDGPFVRPNGDIDDYNEAPYTCIALLLAFVLAACSKQIPQEKVAYVGEWSGLAMALLITQDGSVSYRRLEGGVTKTINAPLKEFQGNNFVVGVGPMSTTFVVSAAPHLDGDAWKMTVDGVELTRKQ